MEMEPNPNVYIYKTFIHLRLRECFQDAVRMLKDLEDQGVSCETGSPRNVRNYIHKISLTILPKYKLNEAENGHAKVDVEKPM